MISARVACVFTVGIGLLAGCASKAPPPRVATTESTIERPPPKPQPSDDNDGISVQGTLGTVKEEDVESVFKARFSSLLDCVKQGKEKFRYLGGAIDVRVKLDQTGAPKTSFLAQSTLGHRAAETCLEKIVAGLRFTPPRGGKEAEFNYPVDFGSPAQVSLWDGARLETRMKSFSPHVRECKRRAPGGLPPNLQLTVYVGPGGRVLSAGLAADAPVPAAIGDCLVEKTRLLRLEDPLGQVAKATVALRD